MTDIATVSVDDKNKVTTNYYDILGIDECKLEVLQNNHKEMIEYVMSELETGLDSQTHWK